MPSLMRRASLYVVHHSSFLDSILDASEHSLDDCDFERQLLRSETIAESAPLLSPGNGLSHDLPIHLLVCHSPWPCIGQTRLFAVRSVLAVYLVVVLFLSLVNGYCCTTNFSDLFFDARYLVLLMQLSLYLITSV